MAALLASDRPVIEEHQFSIGGWCLINPGADPFGAAVRNFELEAVLDVLAESKSIGLVSWHDGDLWPITAPWNQIEDTIGHVQGLLKPCGLKTYNFTANLFSDPAFRSGALGSPIPEVREAALYKGLVGLDAANAFGAEHMIWWDGRGGQDGAYEQDAGLAVKRRMLGLRFIVDYGLARRYKVRHTEEPKLYEPRLKQAYLPTALHAVAAIRHWFPQPGYPERIFTINPEYPQHVDMLTLDAAMEAGLLLELNMLADFIHFGGQIANRMDSDLPPGAGGNILADFALRLTLHRHGWPGVVEFDCRPARTTTTLEGLTHFLDRCTGYWGILDGMLESYLRSEELCELEAALNRPDTEAMQRALKAGRGDVVAEVEVLRAQFEGYEAARQADTDLIERYQTKLLQLVTGRSIC